MFRHIQQLDHRFHGSTRPPPLSRELELFALFGRKSRTVNCLLCVWLLRSSSSAVFVLQNAIVHFANLTQDVADGG